MAKGSKPELPLFTARVVVEIDESRKRFWTHEESLKKKKQDCCMQWSSRLRSWTLKKDCCPVGTHDHFVGSGWVVYAHVNQPWKKSRKNVNKKRRPDIKVDIVADGQIARQLYTADPLSKFLIEGHITTHYNRGRFWQVLNVFSIKAVTDEQVKSQLSIIAFDKFRTVIKEIAQPIKQIPPLEKSFVTQIRERRRAISRGEVREDHEPISELGQIESDRE